MGTEYAVADAKEEKRRMEEEKGRMEKEKGRMEVISGLRRDLEATQAKLERQFEASKEAEGTIQSFREEKRKLGQTNWDLSATNRGLRSTFDQFDQDRRRQSAQTEKAICSKERVERKVEEIREENRALGAKICQGCPCISFGESTTTNKRKTQMWTICTTSISFHSSSQTR